MLFVQTDTTYAHNIEKYVHKVCALAHEINGGDQRHQLRASILQCLSAMVTFFLHITKFILSCLVISHSICCLVIFRSVIMVSNHKLYLPLQVWFMAEFSYIFVGFDEVGPLLFL